MPDKVDWLDRLAGNITGVDATMTALVLIVLLAFWKMPEKRLDNFIAFLPTIKLFGLGLILLRAVITIAEIVK